MRTVAKGVGRVVHITGKVTSACAYLRFVFLPLTPSLKVVHLSSCPEAI